MRARTNHARPEIPFQTLKDKQSTWIWRGAYGHGVEGADGGRLAPNELPF